MGAVRVAVSKITPKTDNMSRPNFVLFFYLQMKQTKDIKWPDKRPLELLFIFVDFIPRKQSQTSSFPLFPVFLCSAKLTGPWLSPHIERGDIVVDWTVLTNLSPSQRIPQSSSIKPFDQIIHRRECHLSCFFIFTLCYSLPTFGQYNKWVKHVNWCKLLHRASLKNWN